MLFKNITILDKEFEPVRNQYVLTDKDRFVYIGSDDPDNLGLVSDKEYVIDGKDKLIMPAFYNTHCHISMTLLRGIGEGLSLNDWLNTKVLPFEAVFEAEEKYWGAMLGAEELISSGCVSVSDFYSCLVRYAKGLYAAGMKANICNGIVIFDPEKSFFSDRSYTDTVEMMNYARSLSDGRMIGDISVHDEFTTTDKTVEECVGFAKENGLRMQIHMSEAKINHDSCVKRRGMTPAQYFEKKGLFDIPTTAAHCVQVTDDDIEILKRHHVFVSHCISSNLKLGSGIAPVKKFYDRGVTVTIGTDGASSNNNLNCFEEMHLAAMVCRGVNHDSNAIPAKEILRIATRNGALAQGREDCGLIDTGMKADFIVLDLDKPHLYPDFDIVSNIVFSAQSSDVWMTVCDGDVLYKNGEFTHLDPEEIKAKARESLEKVLKRM